MRTTSIHRLTTLVTVVSALILTLGLLLASPTLPARANGAGVGGDFVAITPIAATTGTSGNGFAANETRTYHVSGLGEVPMSGVSAVAVTLQVTSTTSVGNGYLTVWNASETKPSTSNMAFNKETAPESNTAMVSIGTSGDIKVFSSTGSTNVAIQVQGYVTTSSGSAGGFVTLNPVRLVDTRYSNMPSPVTPAGTLQAGGSFDANMVGTWGVPTGASAVFANVTVVSPSGDGTLQGTTPALTSGASSAISFSQGPGSASALVLRIDSDGKLRIKNPSAFNVHVIIDIQGYFTANSSSGGGFTPLVKRVFDTRTASSLGAMAATNVKIAGLNGIPASNVGAVALNLTVVNTGAQGWVRTWSTGNPEPQLSNVNFVANDQQANLVFVQPGQDGQIMIANNSSKPVDVVIDVQGYWAASRTSFATSPAAVTGTVAASAETTAAIRGFITQASDSGIQEAVGAPTPRWEVPADAIQFSNGQYEIHLDPRDIPLWAVDGTGLVNFQIDAVSSTGGINYFGSVSARSVFNGSGAAKWTAADTPLTGDDNENGNTASDGSTSLILADDSTAGAVTLNLSEEIPAVVEDADTVEDDPADPASLPQDSTEPGGGTYARSYERSTASAAACPYYNWTGDINMGTKDVDATIGTTYPYGNDSGRMVHTSTANVSFTASLGVAFALPGLSWNQSGMKSVGRSYGFTWNWSKSSRAYRVKVRYKKVAHYYARCVSQGPFSYTWEPSVYVGTTSEYALAHVDFRYCYSQASTGTWERSASSGNSYTNSIGVKFDLRSGNSGASSLGVSRNYGRESKMQYNITAAKHLCTPGGAVPSLASKVSESR